MKDGLPFLLSCPAPSQASAVIELAHGGGGLMTRRLIDEVFRPAFAKDPGDFMHDGAVFEIDGARLAFTTDTYVVRPLFFPGGDIGALAVNGTVNDLAMCGAEPLYLSAGLVMEEGFSIDMLRKIVASMSDAAKQAGIRLVTGDTKVVERGKGDGLYINTAGVGRVIAPSSVGPHQVRPSDAILLSGDIGRHGIAVMAAREDLRFEMELASDCAPLAAPVRRLIEDGIALHCLRDLTRGGLATALIEIAQSAKADLRIEDTQIAVSEPVRGACEILGLDPLYVANEGRFVAIVPASDAECALAVLKEFEASAALIGKVAEARGRGIALLESIGGARALDLLTGEQLPRIC
jgi:hydrogenase expression/formation protein HypE